MHISVLIQHSNGGGVELGRHLFDVPRDNELLFTILQECHLNGHNSCIERVFSTNQYTIS